MAVATPKVKQGSLTDMSPAKERGVSAAEAEAVELDGRKKFFDLRQSWSNWIIGWITSLIIFNVVLTVFVGAKHNYIRNKTGSRW